MPRLSRSAGKGFARTYPLVVRADPAMLPGSVKGELGRQTVDGGGAIESFERAWGSVSSCLETSEAHAIVCNLAGLDLDPAFHRILSHLERFGPANVSELARMQRVNFGFMSRSLKELSELGLVVRLPSADHRCTVVRLTDAGAAMVFRLRAARRLLIGEALAEWDEGDIGHLARLLKRAGNDLWNHLRDPRPATPESLAGAALG